MTTTTGTLRSDESLHLEVGKQAAGGTRIDRGSRDVVQSVHCARGKIAERMLLPHWTSHAVVEDVETVGRTHTGRNCSEICRAPNEAGFDNAPEKQELLRRRHVTSIRVQPHPDPEMSRIAHS
jgi:hypothetical protein